MGYQYRDLTIQPSSKYQDSGPINGGQATCLTHWGRVTHICLTIIGSDNGLLPGSCGWRQAIIWINAGILLIGPLGTIFCEILIKIHIFSLKKMHLKMLSVKWQPFCLGTNVLLYNWYSLYCRYRKHGTRHFDLDIIFIMLIYQPHKACAQGGRVYLLSMAEQGFSQWMKMLHDYVMSSLNGF